MEENNKIADVQIGDIDVSLKKIRSGEKLLDNLPPRTAFKFGLFSGLGIMFVIGFFILLGLMINGDGFNLAFGKEDNNIAAPLNDQPTQPTNNGSVANLKAVEKSDWLRGDKDAKVTIVEFSDIDCPYCQRFHETMKALLTQYDGEVNWVYRHFPLTSLHPNAFVKAEATECAGSLNGNDAFWKMADLLILDKTVTVDQIADKASSLGVNKAKFQKCMDDHQFQQKIQDQVNQAISAGGQGTPYSIIVSGSQRIPINGALPIEQITPQLDSLLN